MMIYCYCPSWCFVLLANRSLLVFCPCVLTVPYCCCLLLSAPHVNRTACAACYNHPHKCLTKTVLHAAVISASASPILYCMYLLLLPATAISASAYPKLYCMYSRLPPSAQVPILNCTACTACYCHQRIVGGAAKASNHSGGAGGQPFRGLHGRAHIRCAPVVFTPAHYR